MKTITVRPRDLSDAAKQLYIKSMNEGHTLQRQEWWTEDLVPAVQELVDAGLATYNKSHFSGADHHYLWTTSIAKAYTSAVGRKDGFQIRVRLLKDRAQRYDDGAVLADLDGAYIERRDSSSLISSGPQWRVILRHKNGTDFEHDSMILADFWLNNVNLVDVFTDGRTILTGTIAEDPHLYGFGVDPFTASDHSDYEPNEDGTVDMCDDKRCRKSHPFGPYIAPKVAGFTGKSVSIEYIAKKVRRG